MSKEVFLEKAAMAAAEELKMFLSAQPEEGIDQDTVSIIEQILTVYAVGTTKRIIQYIYGEEQEEEDVLPFN